MSRIPDGFPKDFLWGGAVAANQLEGYVLRISMSSVMILILQRNIMMKLLPPT